MVSIAILNVTNNKKKVAMNKDLNGGFGTADDYSDSIFSKIISVIKKRSIKLPIISLAFLMGIFKEKGIKARYYEGKLPEAEYDIILIYGSIVDYKNENFVCTLLKRKFKNAQIGFIGPFPSVKPELFKSGDFVIIGDFRYFFLKKFKNKNQLKGEIIIKKRIDLNQLPSPELEGFPIKEYRYSPAITATPFFALQGTEGCPYNCSYYCVYGAFQGNTINIRSPKKVVDDILYLKEKYGIKGFQFRDPTFGVPKGYIKELCEQIKKNKLKIEWGIETKIDLLNEEKIKLMFEAGLRNINVGIETIDEGVAKKNKRLLTNVLFQKRILNYCKKIGVKISAFYIFGYEGSTKETIEATLRYAIKCNTFLARFAIITPYPGTKYFDELERKKKITSHDFEKYSQFNLIFENENLSSEELKKLLSNAYRRYYFRPRYILSLLKWKIRDFWL